MEAAKDYVLRISCRYSAYGNRQPITLVGKTAWGVAHVRRSRNCQNMSYRLPKSWKREDQNMHFHDSHKHIHHSLPPLTPLKQCLHHPKHVLCGAETSQTA